MIILYIIIIAGLLWCAYNFNEDRKEAQKKGNQKWITIDTVLLIIALVGVLLGVVWFLFNGVIPLLERITDSAGNALLNYIDAHFGFFIFLGGIIGFIVYGKYHPRADKTVEPPPQPTMDTYRAVMDILRIAAKRVGPALGLASIHEDTPIKAEEDEQLIQNGAYWRMKYRLPKQNATTLLDESMVRRVLQREIQVVLETDNPGAFDKVRFVRGGSYECIIQIDKVHDYDAYCYIYAVIASEEYFKQRGKKGNSGGSLASRGDDGEF